jgi:hypothetical protein
MSPKEATLKAMEEVAAPVIAIGLILAAVFVPVGFMGGISGQLYQQFAITIALSVLLSVINALTLSPALAGLLLKAPTGKKSLLTPFYNGFNRMFGWVTDRYVSLAGLLARHVVVSLGFIALLMFAIVALVRNIPAGSVPEEDQGTILVNALAARRLFARTHGRRDEEGRSDHVAKNRGVEGSIRSGLQPARRVLVEHGLLLRAAQAVGRAAERGEHSAGSSTRFNRAFAQKFRRLASSPSVRPRSPAWAPAQGSRWNCRIAAARRECWRSRLRNSWRPRASARDRAHRHPYAAPPCRSSMRASTGARCSIGRPAG